jgi:hypothetical protein
MNGVAIGLGLLLSITLVAFITRPWWSKAHRTSELDIATQPDAKHQQATLIERRESLLNTLRDLEFDYSVSKVTQDDYEALRRPLLIEVAEIMAQLDDADDEIYTQIEQDVLTIRETLPSDHFEQTVSSNGTCPACEWVRRPGALYCAKCGAELPPLCPECGQATEATDAFCRECGVELTSSLQHQLM